MRPELLNWWRQNAQALARVTETALEVQYRIQGGLDVARGAYFSSANSRPPLYWAVKAAMDQPAHWHGGLMESLQELEALEPGISGELADLIEAGEQTFQNLSRTEMGDMEWALGKARLFATLNRSAADLGTRLLHASAP